MFLTVKFLYQILTRTCNFNKEYNLPNIKTIYIKSAQMHSPQHNIPHSAIFSHFSRVVSSAPHWEIYSTHQLIFFCNMFRWQTSEQLFIQFNNHHCHYMRYLGTIACFFQIWTADEISKSGGARFGWIGEAHVSLHRVVSCGW